MADATTSLAQDTANLHLDDVTGERVSKSELKKRQKQRQLEEKKKEKAAAAAPRPEKKASNRSAELDESNLNPNVSQRPYPAIASRAKPWVLNALQLTTRVNNSNTSKSAAVVSTDSARPNSRTPTRTSSR